MGKLSASVCAALAAAPVALFGCSALYQQAVAVLRQPGEEVATTPDEIWREFNCDHRSRPFVQAESMEVVPDRMRPGARVNYRLIYVMCPVNPSEVISTRVSRRILYKGQPVAANTNDEFEIKPGRWVVDSFFTLPANSPLGVYALEVSFEAPKGQAHKRVRSFVVSGETYLSGG